MLYKGKEVPFKEEDFNCKCGCGLGLKDMSEELLDKLFRARMFAGVPFVIISAIRCEKHNKNVGGKPNSAHLRGTAVDIKYANSRVKYKMIESLYMVRFSRWGDNQAQKFIHVDCDKELPQEVAFDY